MKIEILVAFHFLFDSILTFSIETRMFLFIFLLRPAALTNGAVRGRARQFSLSMGGRAVCASTNSELRRRVDLVLESLEKEKRLEAVTFQSYVILLRIISAMRSSQSISLMGQSVIYQLYSNF